MRVLDILHDSIVDGEGLRTVIFFAGCSHRCYGCHNPESWNLEKGRIMAIQEIVDIVMSNPLCDVTFSGGDPIYQVEELSVLAQELKSRGKNIWCYTGYTIEQLIDKKDPNIDTLLSNIDVLVDGRFVLEQRDITIPFRGSKNQRILDMRKYYP